MSTGPPGNGRAAPWRVVWITGASSGIGRELALRIAREGSIVAISARSAEKLAEVAALSANIRAFPLDVTDTSAVADAIPQIEAALGPIDLAVLNAGVWHPMTASSYDLEKVQQSMTVNYGGTVNALALVMRLMTARASGHIALIASVAGYRGLPKSASYAPTKAALQSVAESLRNDLAAKGVTITIVNPGFVDTPMTEVNDFPMPFIVSAQTAAEKIHTGLKAKRFEIVFPWQMAVTMKILRLLPYRLYFWITARM